MYFCMSRCILLSKNVLKHPKKCICELTDSVMSKDLPSLAFTDLVSSIIKSTTSQTSSILSNLRISRFPSINTGISAS